MTADPNIVISPELAIAALSVAVGLVKLIEYLVKKLFSKKQPNEMVVKLDPEVSKIIHDTDQNVRDVHMVIGRVDKDGTPMVYSSRSGIETLREIMAMVQETSRSQERLAATLDRLEAKFDNHDKQEQITHSKLQDTTETVLSELRKAF